jgi:CRISPR-associated protein Cas2
MPMATGYGAPRRTNLSGRPEMNTYLVCYDIASNAKRTKLAHLLEKHGERTQRSVFVVTSSPVRMAGLRQRMACYMDIGDELLIVPLCANCLAASLRVGPSRPLLQVV